jgi:signal transduction histidine kinase
MAAVDALGDVAGAPIESIDGELHEILPPTNGGAGGVRMVVAVRVPAARGLSGMMCVGLRERRRPTRNEARLLSALGEVIIEELATLLVVRDLREQLAMLTSEREVRDRFVDTLSHDLRGPLFAAKMALATCARNPERSHRLQDVALRNIARADRMVTDLLDAHRIDAGQPLPLRPEHCDLAQVAREVVDDVSVGFTGRITLHVTEPIGGEWDAEQVRRALWNLIQNALKYGDATAPVLVIVRRRGEFAELVVHNEGPVIPPEEQEAMFRIHYRAQHTLSAHGWGLGLTLVAGCAAAHGGSVLVKSAHGEGTTFTLQLPVGAVASVTDSPSARPLGGADSVEVSPARPDDGGALNDREKKSSIGVIQN